MRHRDDAVIAQTLTISPRAGDTAEGYTMRNMIHAATKIEYKTDGKNVWRFSTVKQEWIPDERMTVSVFENIIATGNGYEK